MNDQHYSFSKASLRDVRSTLVSRNITILGRRTSVRLEPEMWMALSDIAKREKCSIHDICSLVSLRKEENSSLTAAIRVFLMLYYRAACTAEGHMRAGHGSFEAMKGRARIPEGRISCFEKGKKRRSEDKPQRKASAA